MTGLLSDTMHDRADRLDAPELDLEAMYIAGDRRRRHAGWLAAAACTAIAATAIAVPALRGGNDSDNTQRVEDYSFAAAFAANQPTYAKGSTIYIDGHRFDLGHEVRAFVQTSYGVVVADPDGNVWFADGEQVSKVGDIDGESPRLFEDDDLVVWDSPHREGSNTVDGFDPATSTAWEEDAVVAKDGFSAIVALDDGSVYISAQGRIVRLGKEFEADVDLGPDRSDQGFELHDVEAGKILYNPVPSDAGSLDALVGDDLRSGTAVGQVSDGDLAPDGHHLFTNRGDKLRLVDVATGQMVPLTIGDYAFAAGYRWLDNDRFSAIGMVAADGREDEHSTLDLLTCSVNSATCEVALANVGTISEGIELPIGESVR